MPFIYTNSDKILVVGYPQRLANVFPANLRAYHVYSRYFDHFQSKKCLFIFTKIHEECTFFTDLSIIEFSFLKPTPPHYFATTEYSRKQPQPQNTTKYKTTTFHPLSTHGVSHISISVASLHHSTKIFTCLPRCLLM